MKVNQAEGIAADVIAVESSEMTVQPDDREDKPQRKPKKRPEKKPETEAEAADTGCDMDWLEAIEESETSSRLRSYAAEKKKREDRMKAALPPHIFKEWKDRQNSSWGKLVEKIPFGKYARPGDDINAVCRIFDESIVGRESEKSEMLRKYASFCISGRMKRPILLVGEPGCGKSCFAKCMAKATGFPMRVINMPSITSPIALVGSEQHYSNSRMGELTKAVIDEDTLSVVFVLDEIDKIVTNPNEGSVESVLLALFDPVWNGVFVDRSLDVPIDMSHCVFICTANSVSDLSEPLLDRMDVIRFEPYTEAQAVGIIESKTMPGCVGEYDMNSRISFAPGVAQAVVEVLDNGSMRDYEKLVEKLVDNAIFNILRNGHSSYTISADDLDVILPSEKRKPIGFGC